MALIFQEGFDAYGTSGSVKAEMARLWTVPNDDQASITAATARPLVNTNVVGNGITLSEGMGSELLVSRSIAAKSGNKLFVTFSVKPTSACRGKLYFGSDSYVLIDESSITTTFNSVDGTAQDLTTGTWVTIELVLDATADAYQKLYIDGRLVESRQVAPGIDNTLSLAVEPGYTSPVFDHLGVWDGSGTAGNARAGKTYRVVTLAPTATVSNTFAGLTGAANAHSVLDNVPQSDSQFIESKADGQACKVALADLAETPITIIGVQVTALLANRDATGQGVSMATSWAAGSDSTATSTPAETLDKLTAAYSVRGDGTAISAADVAALAVQLTQT